MATHRRGLRQSQWPVRDLLGPQRSAPSALRDPRLYAAVSGLVACSAAATVAFTASDGSAPGAGVPGQAVPAPAAPAPVAPVAPAPIAPDAPAPVAPAPSDVAPWHPSGDSVQHGRSAGSSTAAGGRRSVRAITGRVAAEHAVAARRAATSRTASKSPAHDDGATHGKTGPSRHGRHHGEGFATGSGHHDKHSHKHRHKHRVSHRHSHRHPDRHDCAPTVPDVEHDGTGAVSVDDHAHCGHVPPDTGTPPDHGHPCPEGTAKGDTAKGDTADGDADGDAVDEVATDEEASSSTDRPAMAAVAGSARHRHGHAAPAHPVDTVSILAALDDLQQDDDG